MSEHGGNRFTMARINPVATHSQQHGVWAASYSFNSAVTTNSAPSQVLVLENKYTFLLSYFKYRCMVGAWFLQR